MNSRSGSRGARDGLEREGERQKAMERLFSWLPYDSATAESTPHISAPPSTSQSSPVADLASELEQVSVQTDTPSRAGMSEASRVTDKRREQRDIKFGEWYGDRMYLCSAENPLEHLLSRMGGEGLLAKFRAHQENARIYLKGDKGAAKKKLENCLGLEASKERNSGAFWMDQLARFGKPAQNTELQWYGGTEKYLPKLPSISFPRRADSVLTSWQARGPTWANIAALVEFTEESCPTQLNSISTYPSAARKLLQGISTVIDALSTTQETRLFMTGFATFYDTPDMAKAVPGKNTQQQRQRQLVAYLVDHESVELFRLDDISGDGLASFLGFLRTLLQSSLYELGFSPFFSYHVNPTSGDFVPTLLHLPPRFFVHPSLPLTLQQTLAEPLPLNGDPLNPHAPPFSRGAFVHNILVKGGSEHYIMKIQWVDNGRRYREARVLSQLHGVQWVEATETRKSGAADEGGHLSTDGSADMAEIPAFVAVAGSSRMPCQEGCSEAFRPLRHLEILITRSNNPHTSILQSNVTPHLLLKSLIAVLRRILHHFQHTHQLLHRDLSQSNILLEQSAVAEPDAWTRSSALTGTSMLNDWDCASNSLLARMGDKNPRTGTKDTMSIGLLSQTSSDYEGHHLHHDIESVIIIFYATFFRLVGTLDSQAGKEWRTKQLQTQPFGSAVLELPDSLLAICRKDLWTQNWFNNKKRLAPEWSRFFAELVHLQGEGSLGLEQCDHDEEESEVDLVTKVIDVFSRGISTLPDRWPIIG